MAKRYPMIAEIDWPTFAAAMKEWRGGMSIRQAEEETGISKGTLSRIENGRECSATVFMSACFILEREPTDFRLV